jgi:competence protein ComEA
MPDIEVPNGWRDRLALLAGHRRDSWLVGGLVAVTVIAALVVWSRGKPPEIAPAATESTADRLSPEPGSYGGGRVPASPSGGVLVDVAGAVRRPGLYELVPDARIADAIRAAGGAKPKADMESLNLAQRVVDGQKIDVLRAGQAPDVPVAVPSPGTSGAPPVSINTGDQAALESIPGIGPVTATSILDYRAQIGGFTSVDQLLEVDGIGPVTLEDIRPYVSL